MSTPLGANVTVLRIETPRPALVRVHESTDDDGATVDVSLASSSGTRVGSASGEASASHRSFLVATATLRAILPDLDGEFEVVAATTTGAIGMGSIVGRLSFGWLGDRFNKSYLLALCYALVAVGVLLFSMVRISFTGTFDNPSRLTNTSFLDNPVTKSKLSLNLCSKYKAEATHLNHDAHSS